MTPTVEYVQKKIDEFNELVFSSALPPITVKISKARTYLGKLQYQTRRNFWSKQTNCGYVMYISAIFDLPEREQEDIILHEMIHYFIAYTGQKDTSAHGKLFRMYMDRINKDFGRNIVIRHKHDANLVAASQNKIIRTNYLCFSVLKIGKLGITSCAKSKISEMKRELPRHYPIDRMFWCTSQDPFFNGYPRSRTPKIYKITVEELDPHMKNVTPLDKE